MRSFHFALGPFFLWLLAVILQSPLELIIMWGVLVVGALLIFRRRRPLGNTGYLVTMTPDTMSSLFPDRPIRPLPKRRLRERLSPGVVDSIKYPPVPQSTQPLFVYPYDSHDSTATRGLASHHASGAPDDGRAVRRNMSAKGPENSGDEVAKAVPVTWHSPENNPRLARKPEVPSHGSANLAPSAASSVDGYDSIENTNNKKKRKIPSPGDHALNGGHTLAELSGLTISPAAPTVVSGSSPSAAQCNSSGSGFMSGTQGISGPGRGRFGRSRNGRSPLRALSDTSQNWASRAGKVRPIHWSQPQGTLMIGLVVPH